ncbi:leucine-rich repeat-containing protein 74A-like [Arctopsyche grandis]|uniref:leucine-rich repeat-containing protein 74A-like n=1 Tax=Arctopsyche grandis TaxID=121162 RepID=UPI00406D66FF
MNIKKVIPKRAFGYFDENYDGICLKYIPVLNSDILLHPYYKFPPVKDPEIIKPAVEQSEEEFYRSVCSKLKVNTINLFIDQLPSDEINLKYYGLNSKHIETICRTLMRNNNIKKLDLSYNFLSEASCISLAALLASNQTIECLNLTNCRIQCEGAKQLAEGLKSNTTLRILFLSCNFIKDDGLKAIFSPEITAPLEKCILKRNDLHVPSELISYLSQSYVTLKEIDLSWNVIDVTNGIRPLLRNLKSNESVEVLNLSWNALEKVAIAFKFFFQVNETLRYLDLSYNSVVPDEI